MTQIAYRGNLSSAFFPFISEFQGKTVIVPGQDNNFNRQLQSAADLDKDIGIPQLYYCHNVLPNGNGIQSVGYENRIGPTYLPTSPLTRAFNVRDDSLGRKAYMMSGTNVLWIVEDEIAGYRPPLGGYNDGVNFITFPPNLQDYQITTAHVAGVTYIYINNTICLVYDFVNNVFNAQPLAGLSVYAIIGLTESNGYLIAYSANSVAWSSTILATDFVPSLQTGAGGGSVEGIKGNITCCSPTSNGFTVFTQVNAVSVLYTGNSRYPFQFSECLGSGGVASLERVTYEADSGYNYVYTSRGFQIIQSKSAQTVFADLTDFLAGQYFEDFDEITGTFTYQTLSTPLMKKLTLVAARYLVVSYGINSLTHALVYDVVQKRFGKLKVPHTDCFEYELLSEDVSDIPKKSIAFLQQDGTVKVVNFAVSFVNRNGVAFLGKYQYVRSRELQMQTVSFENPTVGGIFGCNCWSSWDGKNTAKQTEGIIISSGRNTITYGFDSVVGENHSLLVVGCFNLTTIELAFNVHGRM
jgi:hypothetical protein